MDLSYKIKWTFVNGSRRSKLSSWSSFTMTILSSSDLKKVKCKNEESEMYEYG